MADGGRASPLMKRGKRALYVEGEGHEGAAAKKQQESAQTNKNVTDSYVPGVLSTLKRGKTAKTDDARWKKSIGEEIQSGRQPKLAFSRRSLACSVGHGGSRVYQAESIGHNQC